MCFVVVWIGKKGPLFRNRFHTLKALKVTLMCYLGTSNCPHKPYLHSKMLRKYTCCIGISEEKAKDSTKFGIRYWRYATQFILPIPTVALRYWDRNTVDKLLKLNLSYVSKPLSVQLDHLEGTCSFSLIRSLFIVEKITDLFVLNYYPIPLYIVTIITYVLKTCLFYSRVFNNDYWWKWTISTMITHKDSMCLFRPWSVERPGRQVSVKNEVTFFFVTTKIELPFRTLCILTLYYNIVRSSVSHLRGDLSFFNSLHIYMCIYIYTGGNDACELGKSLVVYFS